jgi:hypothetical protein
MHQIKYVLLIFIIFQSCTPKDKFDWNAGFSAPKFYGSTGPFVEYFYQGKSIAGNSGASIAPGWGETSGGVTGGDKYKPVPDSVAVNWVCGADRINYKGGMKLPREKMLALFKEGTTDPYDGRHLEYGIVMAGMAPGGNVTIWMRGSGVNKEIMKFKAKDIGIWMKDDNYYNEFRTKVRKVHKDSEANVFKYLHGIPYSIWETGEKEYDYDVGFSSEDGTTKYNFTSLIFTKDGSVFTISGDKVSIEKQDWNNFQYLPNNNKVKKRKLPVQIQLDALSNDRNTHYSTMIVMPQNFQEIFATPYQNPKTKQMEHYDRLVFGIYKGNERGVIWLEGKGKREKLMEFKNYKAGTTDGHYSAGGYSLPKKFVFPKWNGREPILKPTIDYYQEK